MEGATRTGGKPTTHKKMDPKPTKFYLARGDPAERRRMRLKPRRHTKKNTNYENPNKPNQIG
jgi:hypothetical protein